MSRLSGSSESVSLKEHFTSLLAEKDKALAAALAAAKEATAVAEKNSEKWRDNANEWRGQSKDREDRFALKTEVESLKESTDKAVTDIKTQLEAIRTILTTMAGRKQGLSEVWGWLVGALGLVAIILNLIDLLPKQP